MRWFLLAVLGAVVMSGCQPDAAEDRARVVSIEPRRMRATFALPPPEAHAGPRCGPLRPGRTFDPAIVPGSCVLAAVDNSWAVEEAGLALAANEVLWKGASLTTGC